MSEHDALNDCLDSARELELRRDCESAVTVCEQAVDALSWIPHSRHLRTLHQLGRISEAEELVIDYLRRNPEPPGAALNDFGVLKAEQGKFTDAIKCFSRAMRSPLPPAAPLALGNLAYVLHAAGRAKECAKVCDSVLRTDPDEIRAHYVLSLAESVALGESPSTPAADIVRGGEEVEVFPLLRFEGEPMTKHPAKVVGEDDRYVRLDTPTAQTGAWKHWGILVSSRGRQWCGFSERCGEATADASLAVRLPGEFYLVQRRRWVRVLATGSIARLEVRSFPPGVAPFEVEKLVELNLSGGGAAVRTVPGLPRGTEVVLVLKLDETEQVEVSARVTRICRPSSAKPYSGLSFVKLSETNREKIARFVHRVQLDRKRGTAHVARA